jgi:hypothetical protein
MLLQDGSCRRWLAGQPELDLVVTPGLRHQGDLLGVSGGGGRDGFKLYGVSEVIG